MNTSNQAPSQQDGARSALIVEDDPTVADIIRRTLKLTRFETVGLVATVEQATHHLERACRLDSLIVLDLVLGDGDAFELLSQLAARRFSGPVILVSGQGEKWLRAARSTAEHHGIRVLGAFTKPFSVHRLRDVVESARPLPRRKPPERPKVDGDAVEAAICGGGIEAVFQPKVAVADGRLRGFEVLARWNHPQYGPLAPRLFIPQAEERGLAGRLTDTMLDQALRVAARLKALGTRTPMAINLSGHDLTRPELGDQIEAAVEAWRLAPSDIILEITETPFPRNDRGAEVMLKRLALHGLRLSIDDFGTGHSHLERLADLPFSELKIDRSFVRKARQDDHRRAILESSIRLGRELGLVVVGEGVESISDWNMLGDLGCHVLQGYFISRPLRQSNLEDWIDRHARGLDRWVRGLRAERPETRIELPRLLAQLI